MNCCSALVVGGKTVVEEPDDHGDGWKFNLVMVLVAMFVGMMLTNWGVVQVTNSRYVCSDCSTIHCIVPQPGPIGDCTRT